MPPAREDSPPPTTAQRPAPTAAVWLDPGQIDLIRAAAEVAGVKVVGAGCPQVGRACEVAAALGAAAFDDLRGLLTTHDADLVLLAAPGEFGAGAEAGASAPGAGGGAGAARRRSGAGSAGAGLDDWAVLDDRRARGGLVLTIEPMPASVLQLEAPSLTPGNIGLDASSGAGVVLGQGGGGSHSTTGLGGHAAEWAMFVPSFRRGAAMRAAADVLAHLGPVHTVSAEFLAGHGEGSMGARLFDAVDAVSALIGDAETVDAMYVWPGRGKIVHPTVGETLRGLGGVVTANLRFPDGRAATVLAGDASVGCARWSRRLTIIGEAGRLVVTDAGFEFAAADGQSVDRSGQQLIATAAAVLGEQVRSALDPHAPPASPTDYARVLAVTGAVLLSARTGETESPETIIRMARAG